MVQGVGANGRRMLPGLGRKGQSASTGLYSLSNTCSAGKGGAMRKPLTLVAATVTAILIAGSLIELVHIHPVLGWAIGIVLAWVIANRMGRPKKPADKLFRAVDRRDKSAVAALVNEDNGILNARDSFGRSVLHRAVRAGDPTIVKMVLAITHSVDPIAEKSGTTPLFFATSKEIADILLGAGASVGVRDKTGETPLFSAITHDHFDVAEVIINAGADVRAQERKYRFTPLHHAIIFSQQPLRMVNLLLSSGADPEISGEVDGKIISAEYAITMRRTQTKDETINRELNEIESLFHKAQKATP